MQTSKDQIINIKVGTLIAVMVVCISFLIGIGISYEKIQARLRHLDGKTDLYSERFTALENRVDSNDIKFAEIQKDLSSIETILIEVKQKIQ